MQVAAVASNNLSVISLFYRPHDRSFLNVDEWLLFLEVYSSVEHSVKWRQHRSKSAEQCHKTEYVEEKREGFGAAAAADDDRESKVRAFASVLVTLKHAKRDPIKAARTYVGTVAKWGATIWGTFIIGAGKMGQPRKIDEND